MDQLYRAGTDVEHKPVELTMTVHGESLYGAFEQRQLGRIDPMHALFLS
jgi:hypothetical protein